MSCMFPKTIEIGKNTSFNILNHKNLLNRNGGAHKYAYFVDMRMPIFVVNCFCRSIINARDECGMCEMDCVHIDGEFIGNCFGNFKPNYLAWRKKFP